MTVLRGEACQPFAPLERIAAARGTLEPERAAELYRLIVDVRDAGDRLADALENSVRARE